MSAFDSTWLSIQVVYLQHYLVVAWLVPCETAAILVYVLCTPYNLVPVYIVTSCKTTCVVYACLVVTCHLHCWQDDQDLLTWVWHRYQNKSQHRKLTLEKKILPPLMPGLKPRPFNESGAPPMSYHCCQGVLLCMRPYTTRMNHMNKVAHVLITSASYFALFFSESLLLMRGLKAFFYCLYYVI